MNQIIKILKEKIIEVSKASQQNNKEYNEEYEKVLRSLFFDDGEIEKEIEKKEAIEEELRSENEELKERINKVRESNEEVLENSEKFYKGLQSHSESRKELDNEVLTLMEEMKIKLEELEKEKNDATKRAIQQERENEAIVEQLEEEKQKVEELSAAKERLNKKIEKLKDKNKKLSETMKNQEKEIKIYLDEKETITRKDIEENITQVTQKEDYERIKEELYEAQKIITGFQSEKDSYEGERERLKNEWEEQKKELEEKVSAYQNTIKKQDDVLRENGLTLSSSRHPSRRSTAQYKPDEYTIPNDDWSNYFSQSQWHADTSGQEPVEESRQGETKKIKRRSLPSRLSFRTSLTRNDSSIGISGNVKSRSSTIDKNIDSPRDGSVETPSKKRKSWNKKFSLSRLFSGDYSHEPEEIGSSHSRSRSSTGDSRVSPPMINYEEQIRDLNGTIEVLSLRVNELDNLLSGANHELGEKAKELEKSERDKEQITSQSQVIIKNLREINGEQEKEINRLRNLDRNHEVVELEKNLADNEQKLTTTQNFLQQSLTARATLLTISSRKKTKYNGLLNLNRTK